MREVVVASRDGHPLAQNIEVGPHRISADEPVAVGGEDLGLAPFELLLSALGACTSMTLELYARRKSWVLRSVSVKLSGRKTESGFTIDRAIFLDGDLDGDQRARLIEVATRCPVHKALVGSVGIETRETTEKS